MKSINRNHLWLASFLLLALEGSLLGQIRRYDVIISEIMADPTPAVGLPAAEYVELHNRTDSACLLVGCTLRLGNTVKALPAISIDSGGYAIVVAEKYRGDFESLGIEVYTLSSLSITDGGQQLVLTDGGGQVLHAVAFRKQWHEARIKQDGGWSLELMDGRQPWLGQEGWASSVDPSGGTPGRANSHAPLPPDRAAPRLWRATMTDSLTLRLWCSEPLAPPTSSGGDLFELTPGILLVGVTEVPPHYDALDLHLAAAPDSFTRYRAIVTGRLTDCAGNAMAVGEALEWGMAHPPEAGDLIINELLPHPLGGTDADFVELYNRSDHLLDLKTVKIGSGGDTLPDKAVTAVSSGMLLPPGRHVALCKDRRLTLTQYNCRDPLALVPCDSLPAYANSAGVVFVTDYGLRPLDRLAYDEGMHYGRLTSTEGVSLERLDPERPTQDDGNWHSAAESVGFATPGYANSQQAPTVGDGDLSVEPEVFSPDNDGFEDFACIRLQLPANECRLSICLYDQRGTPVRHLVNNALCGTEALFRWDGDDDRGQPVPSGLYIVDARWWHAERRPGHRRKVVAVYN